jgi:hypothetical protein
VIVIGENRKFFIVNPGYLSELADLLVIRGIRSSIKSAFVWTETARHYNK